MLRRILLASAGAMALAGTAIAADMPVAPPPPPPPLWTGFYIGVNAGGTWGNNNSVNTATANLDPGNGLGNEAVYNVASAGLATTNISPQTTAFIGGGQIGYNWQVDRTWVLGLEADMQWTGEKSSTSLTTVGPRYGSSIIGLPVGLGADFNAIASQTAALSYNLQWFATFRGRAGVLVDPQTLLYGTGGLAVGDFKYTAQTTTSVQVFTPGLAGTTPLGPPLILAGAAASSSDTRVGWTVGAGIERKFSPNWSGKLEYLYMDFGTKTYFAGTVNQADVSFHDNIFRAGINYEFNPTPVVAKY